jgi:phage repressor protein C with HTH and peptisase S24 domain
VAIVRGRSMLPLLRDGDRLLVRYAAAPRPGQVVVARFADGTVVVKRATERRTTRGGAPGWWLLSDNADEGRADSRARGVVADDAVLGVVRWRLWPRPRRV